MKEALVGPGVTRNDVIEPDNPPAERPDPFEGAVPEAELRVNRAELLQHLKRLYCNGEVAEVALSGPLCATAWGLSKDFIVTTPGLADIESLPAEIGVRIDTLVTTLNCLDAHEIELRLEGGQLVCSCPDRRIRIATIDPLEITTRPDPQVTEKVAAMFPADAWQAFNSEVTRGVVQAIQGLRVERESARGGLAVRVSPEGMTISVGHPSVLRVEFDVPEVRSEVSYALLLSPAHIRAVFAVVGNSEPAIGLIGPNAVMGVRLESKDRSEVQVTYVISPLEETRGRRGAIPRVEAPEDVGA